MGLYAYRDIERKNIVYASNAIREDRDKFFYCPNIFCKARLHICAVDGSKKAYFRATEKQYPHVAKCFFSSSSNWFDDSKYQENNFFFEKAMDDLFVETEKQKNIKYSDVSKKQITGGYTPRTLRQIYLMGKSHPVTDTYGDKEIGEMILDDRSLYRYPKGCFGKKIIESCINGRVYDNMKKQIFLVAPIVNKK